MSGNFSVAAFFRSIAASKLAIVHLSRDTFVAYHVINSLVDVVIYGYSLVKMPKPFSADLHWRILCLRLYKGLKCKTIAELLYVHTVPQL